MARKRTTTKKSSGEPKVAVAKVDEGKISKATKGNTLADSTNWQKASVMYIGKISGIKGNRKINSTVTVDRNKEETANDNQADVSANDNATTTANGSKVAETADGNHAEVSAVGKQCSVKKCVGGKSGCKAGNDSDCPIRSGREDDGTLSCQQVHALLKSMGVKYPGKTSRCIRAAIMRGYIHITGHKADLDQVVFETESGIVCNHGYKATLKQLLYQPDNGGMWYEQLEEAPIKLRCQLGRKCEDKELNKAFVTGLCMGQPELDSGKFHNHCEGCPAFGVCLGDYRDSHFNAVGQHTDTRHWLTGCGCALYQEDDE